MSAPHPNAELTYVTYLKVDELLSLQHPKSQPEHPDELLFIVVHQASELWFKLILHELDHLTQFLEQFNVLKAIESLNRVNGIAEIVMAQLHALDTLAPQHFAQFRNYLGTSSGGQSYQFRAVELISGLRAPDYIEYVKSQQPVHPVVQQALERPSLPDLFDRLVAHFGIAVDDLYASDDHLELRMLAEGLLAYEQAFGRWRFVHVQLVERIIGIDTTGTGGSAGAKALRQTLENRFFPQLWAARSAIFHGRRNVP